MRNTIFLIPILFMAWQPLIRHTVSQDNYLPNPVPVPRRKFTVIAHRGDHVMHPENTLAAYAQAIKDGADYVEIDLRTTKDGQLVSLHNPSVDRMTNGKGLVKDMLWKDIQKLKINNNDQDENLSIPTFQRILKLCRNKIYLYIDFKEADPAVAYSVLKQYGMEKQVLVYINSHDQFTAWRKAAPKIPLMVSLPDEVKDSTALMSFINQNKPDVLDGDYKQYDRQLVAVAKSHHLPVWPDGQSNTEGPAVWDEAIAKGLSGLQTDHPKDFINYLNQKGLRVSSKGSRADTLAEILMNHPEQIMVAAHRSAHQHYPENSLGALKEAISLGVDIAETDIRQTKDRVLVIMHNDKVDHTTNGKGELASYTYHQLLQLRLSKDGKATNETVPTLEQFLTEARGKILVDLDFKLDDDDALKRTYQVIEKTRTENQVLFFLYDYKKVPSLYQLNPKVRLMPRAYNVSDVNSILAMKTVKVIHIDESFYSDSLMKNLKDQHIRVWSNSLGKYDDLQQSSHSGFKALLNNTKNVNVIQTNLPKEWLKYLKQLGLH